MKLSFSFTAVALTALFLTGCAGTSGVPFNEADFAGTDGVGRGSVRGRDYLTDSSGVNHVGAKTRVKLIPANAYTTDLVQREMGGSGALLDSHLAKYTRTTQTDDDGNFQFLDLLAGDYYVTSKVSYEMSTETDQGEVTDMSSGRNYAQVTVKNGQVTMVGDWHCGPVETEHDRW